MADKLTNEKDDMTLSEVLDTTSSTKKQDEANESSEIIDYVQKLIARMNSSSTAAPSHREEAPATKPNSASITAKPKNKPIGKSDGTNIAAEDKSPTNTSKRAQLRPSKVSDCRDSLNRLREAANLTTMNALQSFSHKNQIRSAYRWFCCAFGFIVYSVIVLTMGGSENSIANWTCRVGLVVSIVSTVGYCLTVRRISKQISSLQSQNP